MNTRLARAGTLFLLLLLPACAFARRDNRPVWNAFEEHLVPDDPTAFACALPLTVPGGLLAILTDLFVAHPIQVVDDAVDDAGALWRNGRPDYAGRYYSEVAFTPVRAAITPVVFLGSFVGRSMFDTGADEDTEAARAAADARAKKACLAWLQRLADGQVERAPGDVPDLDDELRQAAERALRGAGALGRLDLYRLRLVDDLLGLRDADPAVRFVMLQRLGDDERVPTELRQALLADPDEAVRQLAQLHWRSR